MANDETPDETREAIEAAAFRRLLAHLDANKDVQNIDLMIVGDFCRNCLSRWYREEAAARGVAMTDEAARERIYGMAYADWKAAHQEPASPEQLAALEARAKRG
ncbi:MAG: DUF1244 domain-containing protein [Parvularculaceae bacterium]